MKSVKVPVTLCLERTLQELNHDSERFYAIAAVAIQDLPMLADELQTAIEQRDIKLVKHMSRSIQGVASNFRAEPLMHLAERLARECDSLAQLPQLEGEQPWIYWVSLFSFPLHLLGDYFRR